MTSDDREQQPAEMADEDSVAFGSNAVRLSAHDWVLAVLIVLAVVIFTPMIWKRVESFEGRTDYRVPYERSEDYWTYERFLGAAIDDGQIPVIGDSVVWGEYVEPGEALSHHLNEQVRGRLRFANGGVNGTHPLALQGLVDNYARPVSNSRVILHCNLLWMSSAERDLQTQKEMSFNHPQLVPQFAPSLPCYKAPVDERIGVVIDQRLPFRKWVQHLRVAYFESQDVHSYSLEHPYENPAARIRLTSPQPENEPHSRPIPWTERGIPVQDIPWVELDTSLQWRAFRATAEKLRDRGNRLFVVVGPFNEHLLNAASRARYRALRRQVENWLDGASLPYHAPEALPSVEYADASHPLRQGYARMARRISESAPFQRWLAAAPAASR